MVPPTLSVNSMTIHLITFLLPTTVVLPTSKFALTYSDPSLPYITSQTSSVTIPSFEYVEDSIDPIVVSDEEKNDE